MKYFILLCYLCLPCLSLASSLNFDVAQTSTIFNRFSIPSSELNQLSTPTDKIALSYRFTGYFDLASANKLYLMIAPLEVSYSFKSTKNFRFNKTDFSTDTDTEVAYKFNSYRIGYLWHWNASSFRYWLGVVAKIRDAKISVSQAAQSDSYDNIGFVPLASIGFDWKLFSNFSLFHHTDALGASQGSAYDSQLELKYSWGSFASSVGKRVLGGGADNEKVYNFAQFDSYYLRMSYLF